MDIGNNIRTIRKAQEMTQIELAKRLNTRAATISQYENSRTDLQVSTLIRIADALGVTLTELTQQTAPEKARSNHRQSQLLKVFNTLNEAGQKETLHLCNLLAEIDRYKI